MIRALWGRDGLVFLTQFLPTTTKYCHNGGMASLFLDYQVDPAVGTTGAVRRISLARVAKAGA